MTVDVEVVVGALLDAAQRIELGQDHRSEAELVEQRHAAQRVRPADQLAQLDQLALTSGLGCPPGFGAGQRDRPRVDLEGEVGGKPAGAQQAQRVLGEAALPDHAQQATVEVGEPPVRVDRLAARKWHRYRADREVAPRQIGLDRLATQRGDVDLPGSVGGRPPARSQTPPRARRRGHRPRERSSWP